MIYGRPPVAARLDSWKRTDRAAARKRRPDDKGSRGGGGGWVKFSSGWQGGGSADGRARALLAPGVCALFVDRRRGQERRSLTGGVRAPTGTTLES